MSVATCHGERRAAISIGGILIVGFFLTIVSPATARYSGGTGEPNDPYQIATAADLIALGETPEDYDKHFILTADIDLDPNLPGGKVFDKAVIAPEGGRYFRGIFEGNRRTISRLRIITNENSVGLFGQLLGEVRNLGVTDVNITSSASGVGGLVGNNSGSVTQCFSNGAVVSTAGVWSYVGGLVGINDGTVTRCHSRNRVRGTGMYVGGLVGYQMYGAVTQSYSNSMVSGTGTFVGGLVGYNAYGSSVTQCYSTGVVSGNSSSGGLVGYGSIAAVAQCFWDTQTSGQATSAGGTGKTTTEMQTAKTFLEGGWDFVGETANGSKDIWKIAEGMGYPRLAWEKYSGGTGEPNDPYQIATAADLITLGEMPEDYDKHFILTADIDLDPNLPGRKVFAKAVIAPDTNDATYGQFEGAGFAGVIDGSGHTISHMTIKGGAYIGLFGVLEKSAEIRNLEVQDVNIVGPSVIGGLVGLNCGHLTQCRVTGTIAGRGERVGGLVGQNGRQSGLFAPYERGVVTRCCSLTVVTGTGDVGGLVGTNGGAIGESWAGGAVTGEESVGGLVGANADSIPWLTQDGTGWMGGTISDCYSSGSVAGESFVGGLVGNNHGATVSRCYSAGPVSGESDAGGLVGNDTVCISNYGCHTGVAVTQL